jgi:hypothetical protein
METETVLGCQKAKLPSFGFRHLRRREKHSWCFRHKHRWKVPQKATPRVPHHQKAMQLLKQQQHQKVMGRVPRHQKATKLLEQNHQRVMQLLEQHHRKVMERVPRHQKAMQLLEQHLQKATELEPRHRSRCLKDHQKPPDSVLPPQTLLGNQMKVHRRGLQPKWYWKARLQKEMLLYWID